MRPTISCLHVRQSGALRLDALRGADGVARVRRLRGYGPILPSATADARGMSPEPFISEAATALDDAINLLRQQTNR